MDLPGALEATLVSIGTVLGCLVLTELVIRRSPWLRLPFGMKTLPRGPRLGSGRPVEQP